MARRSSSSPARTSVQSRSEARPVAPGSALSARRLRQLPGRTSDVSGTGETILIGGEKARSSFADVVRPRGGRRSSSWVGWLSVRARPVLPSEEAVLPREEAAMPRGRASSPSWPTRFFRVEVTILLREEAPLPVRRSASPRAKKPLFQGEEASLPREEAPLPGRRSESSPWPGSLFHPEEAVLRRGRTGLVARQDRLFAPKKRGGGPHLPRLPGLKPDVTFDLEVLED
jgi:hypothetical protein